MTRAGRNFIPDASEKTKPTSTTSPRLQMVIGRVFPVVPKFRQYRICLCRQRYDSLGIVTKILMKTILNRFDHVLPQGKVALGRRQPEAMPYLRQHVNADAQASGSGIRL